ncbi:MAG: hypothetical protein R2798_11825 [Chitinophagales bacterium]|nr:hypothetical protein [Bacteroidota bacterium]MCB9043588.1 hypothetical protein [Chitinophagales bacterium]
MLKYTETTLKKLEQLFQLSGVQIRYGKGNFQSGFCILQEKNIIVINKFYETEARINTLLDLLQNTTLPLADTLSSDMQKLLHQIAQQQENALSEKP